MAGVLALVAAGCSSTSNGPETASAQMSERSSLVGTWTGSLEGGASVRVKIPASGNASYSFEGSSVPVTSTAMSGSSLVLKVGAGGGTVKLSPQGTQLRYNYSYMGQRASTLLSKS
jgi:hypothetical protein